MLTVAGGAIALAASMFLPERKDAVEEIREPPP
jgi:hypothetical protein